MTGKTTHIHILLAVHNGARFLPAQLDSLAAQHHNDWSVIASDDGPEDGSADIIARFAAQYPAGQVSLIRRPVDESGYGQGAAANFRFLLDCLPDEAAFAALCDQDDVWLPDKLSRAWTALQAVPPDQPALWCSAVTICDDGLRPLKSGRIFNISPSFRHALVENLVQGNTILLNSAAIRLLRAANAEAGPVVMHDWWIYQLVSGAGGQVVYDRVPSVLYRQHDSNVVGAGNKIGRALAPFTHLIHGRYGMWLQCNQAAMTATCHRLNPDGQRLLTLFAQRRAPLPKRLAAFRRGGFHRQGWWSQLALWVAVFLRKS